MHETDYEQGEAVKQWFVRWGNYLVGAVVVVALAYGGWWFWQDQQQQARLAASDQYQSLVRLVDGTANLEAAQRQQLETGVEALVSEYAGSTYALYAQMLQARVAAANGDFDAASTTLEAAANAAGDNHPLAAVLNYRLARALFAAGQADAALARIEQVAPAGQRVAYEELRGDIFMARGERETAHRAYAAAWELAQELGIQNAFLRLKAQNAGAL